METTENQKKTKPVRSTAGDSRPKSRVGRTLVLLFLFILVLLGALFVSLPFLFKYQAESWYASQGENQQLVVGNIDISPFTGKVALEGITARKNGKLVFSLESINGEIGLDPLLKGNLDFGALKVVGLKVVGTSGHDGIHIAGLSLPLATTPGALLPVTAFQSLEMTDGAVVWDADGFTLAATLPSLQVGGWSPSSGLTRSTIKADLSITRFDSTINKKAFALTQPANLIVDGSVRLSDTGLLFTGGFETGSIVIEHPSAESLVSRLESLQGDGLTLSRGELLLDQLSFAKAESWLLGTVAGADQVKTNRVTLDNISLVKDKLVVANLATEQLQIRNRANQAELLSVARAVGEDLSLSPGGFYLNALQLGQPTLLGGDGSVKPLMVSEQILVSGIRGESTVELPTAETIDLEGVVINTILDKNGKLTSLQNSNQNEGKEGAEQRAGLMVELLTRVGKTNLLGRGEFHYLDNSVTPLVALDANIDHLVSKMDRDQGHLEMVVQGEIAQYGTYSIDLDLEEIEKGGSGEVTVAIKELDLPPLAPYLDKFVGTGFQAGMLDLSTIARFDKGRFKGVIESDLTHLELGQQGLFGGRSEQASLSMSLQPLLTLIGQSERDMKLSVPIEGDLNNPEFKFWSVLSEGVVKAVKERLNLGIKGVGDVSSSNPMGIFGLIPNMAQSIVPGDVIPSTNKPKLRLKSVYFDPASKEFNPAAKRLLSAVVKLLNSRAELKIKLCPETSNQESQRSRTAKATLLEISKERASRIKAHLVEKGISSTRLISCAPKYQAYSQEGGLVKLIP